MALAERGIPTDGHYALDADGTPPSIPSSTTAASADISTTQPSPTHSRAESAPATVASSSSADVVIHEDGGIDL